MALDIHVTLTLDAPQIFTLGAQIMDRIQTLRDDIANVMTELASLADANANQLTIILAEMGQLQTQLHTGTIAQEDLDALSTSLRAAATSVGEQAALIRANSVQIQAMVPDEPPPVEEPPA